MSSQRSDWRERLHANPSRMEQELAIKLQDDGIHPRNADGSRVEESVDVEEVKPRDWAENVYRPDVVAKAVGDLEDLRVVRLEFTSRADAEAAVRSAVDRFGRIDVLVNNAGTFDAGYFEELTPEQVERQLATSILGPMNVTRAVLPIMRKQRSGHIISISSGAGLVGFEFCSAYAAAKFGLEGWMESLRPEVEPFGIHTTIVNPGFFRTKLLTKESMTFADRSIEDYADRRAEQLKWWEAQNGRQPGDPAKLARALVRSLASSHRPAGSSLAPMPSPS